MLVKHVAPDAPIDAAGLVAQGIVDAAFPAMLGAADACVAGAGDHAKAAEAIRDGRLAGTPILSQRRLAERAHATGPRVAGGWCTDSEVR
jgi:hypothetical protein